MSKPLTLIVVLAAAAACEPHTPPRPTTGVRIDGTNRQNPENTHSWFVWKASNGDEHIVYCDPALVQTSKTLCLFWPPQSAPPKQAAPAGSGSSAPGPFSD